MKKLLAICALLLCCAGAAAKTSPQRITVINKTSTDVYVFDWGDKPIHFLKLSPERYLVRPHGKYRDNDQAIILSGRKIKDMEKGGKLRIRFYDRRFIDSIPIEDLPDEVLCIEEQVLSLETLRSNGFSITLDDPEVEPLRQP